MDVAELNSLERAKAAGVLATCCSSRVWVDRMVAARPFRDTTAILMAAEEAWWDLGAEDWQEAFAAHRQTSAVRSDYEDTFGYPYLVFDADRSSEDLEALYGRRLDHDALAELSLTATEQARITNLELRRLLEIT